MSMFKRRVRSALAGANDALGRRTGRIVAPSPLPNSLAAELKTLLTGLNISHVLDVGAHRGGFGRRLRRDVGYQGPITSFEPSPAHYRILLEEVTSDPNWSAVNVALGAQQGMADFHQYAGGDGQFDSLRRFGPHVEMYAGDVPLKETIAVLVERLDAVWPKVGANPVRTFLKVDTQGFDLEVLAGAGALLSEFPAVLLEAAVKPLYVGAPTVADVLASMAMNRFELTGAFPIHRYASGLRVIEFDCTFVNERIFEG